MTPSQVDAPKPGSHRSPPDEDAPPNERDPIQHIADETTTYTVKRRLDDILTSLPNVEQQSNRKCQQQQSSALRNLLEALESSTNRSIHSIKALLEDIHNHLDRMEAGAPRLIQTTHRREQQHHQKTRQDLHEDCTDNEEEQGLSTLLSKRTSQAGTSSAQ